MQALTESKLNNVKSQDKYISRPKVVWLLIGMQIILAIGALEY